MTLQTILTLSILCGLIAYSLLTVFCVVQLWRGVTGRALLVASSTTLAFVVSLAIAGTSAWTASLELLAVYFWLGLVVRALGLRRETIREDVLRPVRWLFALASAFTVLGLGAIWWTARDPAIPGAEGSGLFVCEVLLSVTGLVAIEQLVRNAREDLRWRLRYLNIGLALYFVYSLVQSSIALLLGGQVPLLVVLQPAVLALAAPLIAIASLRNPSNELRLNLSRTFVFRSGVLIAAGTGLLLLGLVGYYVQLFDGDAGIAALLLLATLFCVGLFVIGGSSPARRRVARWTSEHLYEDKHDYKEAWRRVTRQLTEPSPDFDLGQQAIRTMLDIFESTGGALWRLTESGGLVLESSLNVDWRDPLSPATGRALASFYTERNWIIDLDSIPPEAAPHLAHCEDLRALPGIRHLVPLSVNQRLFGVIAMQRSSTPVSLGWEDYDLLKLISLEVAGFLALRHADARISESRQFAAFSRLSAFVVHDMKTIGAQLKLLTQNAERHKSNPDFVEDMLDTARNAVGRIDRLLGQLKAETTRRPESTALGEVIPALTARFENAVPLPRLEPYNPELVIRADRDKTVDMIAHVVQNAIDATAEHGRVVVHVDESDHWLDVVVEDSGCGMEPGYIADHLFTPFDSTKGLTGMGIGAYQVREYLRSIGGDVAVASTPGVGTRFTLKFPVA